MDEKRFCLQCDDGTELVHQQQDVSFTYREQQGSVLALSGWHCPVCGDCEFDPGEGQRYSRELDAFAAKVDSELASFVRQTRKKLGLKQAEAAKIFGGGVNAFSEYERCKTHPHKSVVLLLKLLDRHPELLTEIRTV